MPDQTDELGHLAIQRDYLQAAINAVYNILQTDRELKKLCQETERTRFINPQTHVRRHKLVATRDQRCQELRDRLNSITLPSRWRYVPGDIYALATSRDPEQSRAARSEICRILNRIELPLAQALDMGTDRIVTIEPPAEPNEQIRLFLSLRNELHSLRSASTFVRTFAGQISPRKIDDEKLKRIFIIRARKYRDHVGALKEAIRRVGRALLLTMSKFDVDSIALSRYLDHPRRFRRHQWQSIKESLLLLRAKIEDARITTVKQHIAGAVQQTQTRTDAARRFNQMIKAADEITTTEEDGNVAITVRVNGNEAGEPTKDEKTAKVLSMIILHPDWTVEKYAETVGWTRPYLYQIPRIKTALDTRRTCNGRHVHRGSKENGTLEAVDD